MTSTVNARPWREIEITLFAAHSHTDPYTTVEVWADFTHSDGQPLRRPAFWDGGNTWKIRFASPLAHGQWSWSTGSNTDDNGLNGQTGTVSCESAPNSGNRFYDHGFWRMSPGHRNLMHSDGTPCLLVGDTAWALPWRATVEQCEVYAADRQMKGFNAALLMTIQPDMRATGPRSRTEDYGFDVAFEDLPAGHLNQLNVPYFQYLDQLTGILVAHEIVPVYQPVFHGYGWKGLGVAGPGIDDNEYARYCRYLVARYGARPAIYLVGGDGHGYYPHIDMAGKEIEEWDCYGQPVGIHYGPNAGNCARQNESWLDFQWCQTGHNGEHVPERVADMWRNTPIKGVANGEPTYENIGWQGNGAGWWQGHEAWCNLCAGGTMGTVYGAGSLWQWKLHKDEPGHQIWCEAEGAGWREALDFEGSNYVGVISRIFDGLPFTDMQPNWDFTYGRRGLAIPGKLFIVYLADGGDLLIVSDQVPPGYRVIDPRDGRIISSGQMPDDNRTITAERGAPIVVICSETFR